MPYTPSQLTGAPQQSSGDPLMAALLQQAIAKKAEENKGFLGIGGMDAGQVGSMIKLAGSLGEGSQAGVSSGSTSSTETTDAQGNPIYGPPAPKKKEDKLGIGSGALQGAQIGAFGGPVGMGIGAILGGLLGAFT